jgi:hypothetical protein
VLKLMWRRFERHRRDRLDVGHHRVIVSGGLCEAAAATSRDHQGQYPLHETSLLPFAAQAGAFPVFPPQP